MVLQTKSPQIGQESRAGTSGYQPHPCKASSSATMIDIDGSVLGRWAIALGTALGKPSGMTGWIRGPAYQKSHAFIIIRFVAATPVTEAETEACKTPSCDLAQSIFRISRFRGQSVSEVRRPTNVHVLAGGRESSNGLVLTIPRSCSAAPSPDPPLNRGPEPSTMCACQAKLSG